MHNIRKLSLIILIILASILFYLWSRKTEENEPDNKENVQELPYIKYGFEELGKRDYNLSKIEIGRVITENNSYKSSVFYYNSDGKKISGQVNFPKNDEVIHPIVIMARGYAEKDGYVTGTGTKNAAAYYASNGYMTLAPDFTGFGESDPEETNVFGARLTRPVEILNLLASVPSLPQADLDHVYLWGHSNGGQIMLSVAEILGKSGRGRLNIRGLTLWAPVSKPFPYSVLYYTDEAEDHGKWLRSELAEFEKYYNVYNYSIDKYLQDINLPVQLHQGTSDEAVPKKWSDGLENDLKKYDKEVTYFVYPGANHNLQPGWNTVVERDIAWFDKLK